MSHGAINPTALKEAQDLYEKAREAQLALNRFVDRTFSEAILSMPQEEALKAIQELPECGTKMRLWSLRNIR